MKVARALAFALAPLVGAGAVEEIRFAPEEGAVLVKTFESVAEGSSESTSDEGRGTSSTFTSERRLVVTDTYAGVADGRVVRLERVYDEIASETESEMEFDGDSRDVSNEGTSEVEGAAVVFEWDEDEEEHVATSDEVDDDVLAELVFDLDFTALLPDGEVEEGDEWYIDLEDFKTMTDPWEGLPWDFEDSEGRTFSSGSDDDRPEPDIEEDESGEIVVTFAGTREEDGVTVAVLSIAGEIETERTFDFSNEFEQGSSTVHSETSEERAIEGEALWDVEAGRLLSLALEIEVSSSGVSENKYTFGDREFENVSENEREATATFAASFELPE